MSYFARHLQRIGGLSERARCVYALSMCMCALLWVVLLVGCSYEGMIDAFEPKEESAFAKQVLDDIRTGNIAPVLAVLNEDLKNEETEVGLSEIAGYFPEGEPTRVSTIGAITHQLPHVWLVDLTYEYEFDSGYAVAQVLIQGHAPDSVVNSVHVTRLEQSLSAIHQFTLKGKSVTHYLFLALSVIVPVFIVITLAICFQTHGPRRKWLWIVFIALGLATFSLNWTTGDISVSLISFQVLGASASRLSPYAAWFVAFSIPLGAILFLLKKRRGFRVEGDGSR